MENISVLSGNSVGAISLRIDGVCVAAEELVGRVIYAGPISRFSVLVVDGGPR